MNQKQRNASNVMTHNIVVRNQMTRATSVTTQLQRFALGLLALLTLGAIAITISFALPDTSLNTTVVSQAFAMTDNAGQYILGGLMALVALVHVGIRSLRRDTYAHMGEFV